MNQEPFIGAMVHWIVPCGRKKGIHLPACVVEIKTEQRCELHVLSGVPAETAHFTAHYMPSIFDPSAQKLGSWHWQEAQ